MILLVHLLFGAAVGSSVKNLPIAIILAFLGHYFLDLFPHIEYPIENIRKKQKSQEHSSKKPAHHSSEKEFDSINQLVHKQKQELSKR